MYTNIAPNPHLSHLHSVTIHFQGLARRFVYNSNTPTALHTQKLLELIRCEFIIPADFSLSFYFIWNKTETVLPVDVEYIQPDTSYNLRIYNPNQLNNTSITNTLITHKLPPALPPGVIKPQQTNTNNVTQTSKQNLQNGTNSIISTDKSNTNSNTLSNFGANTPLQNGSVIALWSYTAGSSTELSFEAGEHIRVLGKYDDNWLKGCIGTRRGFFPNSFVSGLEDINFESSDDEVDPNKPLPNKLDYQDDEYFDSYSTLTIHHQMLSDDARTSVYQRAVNGLSDIIKGKIVLDVGCGSGILSIFCAKAGAKHVYGVDASDIIGMAAQDIVNANKLQDNITLITGKIEEIKLPVEKVDIIISEWMGTYLVCESMIESILLGRELYLKPDTGLMLPSYSRLYMQPVEMVDHYRKHINYWSSVYGVDMNCVREKAKETFFTKPLYQEIMNPEYLVGGKPAIVMDCNMHNYTIQDLEFSEMPVYYEMEKDGFIHGFCAWFDTDFHKSQGDCDWLHNKIQTESRVLRKKKELFFDQIMSTPPKPPQEIKDNTNNYNDSDNNTNNNNNNNNNNNLDKEDHHSPVITLHTSPASPSTHWKQVTFLLQDPIKVTKGQIVFGSVSVRRNQVYRRHFETRIDFITEDLGLYDDSSEIEKTLGIQYNHKLIEPRNEDNKYETYEKDGKKYLRRNLRYDLWR